MYTPSENIEVLESNILLDARDLLGIYNEILEPYLPMCKLFLDIEKLIINELYKELEGSYYYEDNNLFDFLASMYIPTGIYRNFLYRFKSSIKSLVSSINLLLVGNIVCEITPIGSYLLTAKVCKFKIHEVYQWQNKSLYLI